LPPIRAQNGTNPGKQKTKQAFCDRKGLIMREKSEKELLQAQHRVEEAQQRNRVRERKERTHRLIQEAAILESVYPECAEMELEQLKTELSDRFTGRP